MYTDAFVQLPIIRMHVSILSSIIRFLSYLDVPLQFTNIYSIFISANVQIRVEAPKEAVQQGRRALESNCS